LLRHPTRRIRTDAFTGYGVTVPFSRSGVRGSRRYPAVGLVGWDTRSPVRLGGPDTPPGVVTPGLRRAEVSRSRIAPWADR